MSVIRSLWMCSSRAQMMTDAIAIVPARGGSKRISRKNIRTFHGRPLLAHTLETLLTAGLFSDVVVSTDDDEVAAVAEAVGARVPFRRPNLLADDYATTAQVVTHALGEMSAISQSEFRYVCVAYPAAVLVAAPVLAKGRELIIAGQFDFVFAGGRYRHPIQRAWRRNPYGEVEMVEEQFRSWRTQDLEPLYHDAGQFYWSLPDAWTRIESGESVRTGMLELEPLTYCDVDEESDWMLAELLYSLRSTQGGGGI